MLNGGIIYELNNHREQFLLVFYHWNLIEVLNLFLRLVCLLVERGLKFQKGAK